MAKSHLACRGCHFINDPDKQTCENCGSNSLTGDRVDYAVIIHPEDSRIATEMNVTKPDGYALKIR